MPDRDQLIVDALAKALSHVDKAEEAKSSQDASSYRQLLWKAAAEAEYAAFQISITRTLSEYDPSTEEGETDPPEATTAAARQLLQEALSRFPADSPKAYAATRTAVTLLRRMYVAGEWPVKGKASPKNE